MWWIFQEKGVIEEVSSALKGEKLDAIICVAGGWAGGNAAAKGDFLLFSSSSSLKPDFQLILTGIV